MSSRGADGEDLLHEVHLQEKEHDPQPAHDSNASPCEGVANEGSLLREHSGRRRASSGLWLVVVGLQVSQQACANGCQRGRPRTIQVVTALLWFSAETIMSAAEVEKAAMRARRSSQIYVLNVLVFSCGCQLQFMPIIDTSIQMAAHSHHAYEA